MISDRAVKAVSITLLKQVQHKHKKPNHLIKSHTEFLWIDRAKPDWQICRLLTLIGLKQISWYFSWTFWDFVWLNKDIYSCYERQFLGGWGCVVYWLQLTWAEEAENNWNNYYFFLFPRSEKGSFHIYNLLKIGRPDWCVMNRTILSHA